MLHREAYYERNNDDYQPSDIEDAEIIIAKHRNGPTGTVKLEWIPKYTRFRELA